MPTKADSLRARVLEAIRRALSQFLALPLLVVAGFLALYVASYWMDDAWSGGHVPPGFAWLGKLLGDNQALSSLLSTVASSIITVTSITFSLLLVAVQQGSSALTAQVTDQFLMRRTNQFYFGFFVGLSVFVLLTLVTVNNYHRPIFGATIALIGTSTALCMIVVMIYNTIEQMRPEQIIRAIHGHVLGARKREEILLSTTRRTIQETWQVITTVRSESYGYLVRLDYRALRDAVEQFAGENTQVCILAPIGSALAVGDPLFALRACSTAAPIADADLERFTASALEVIELSDGRNLRDDPAFGISQLAAIAWTSISTAKSNPGPGLAVLHALRDIFTRWTVSSHDGDDRSSPIVYPDRAYDATMDVLEQIIVVSSESIQAQTLAQALTTLALMINAGDGRALPRLCDVAVRAVSSLGEHVLTRDLETALSDLVTALEGCGQTELARLVADAADGLRRSLGQLNSRSTRVPDKS